jgi:hypothetical protein
MRLRELIRIKYTELAIVNILIKILLSHHAARSGVCTFPCSGHKGSVQNQIFKFLIFFIFLLVSLILRIFFMK